MALNNSLRRYHNPLFQVENQILFLQPARLAARQPSLRVATDLNTAFPVSDTQKNETIAVFSLPPIPQQNNVSNGKSKHHSTQTNQRSLPQEERKTFTPHVTHSTKKLTLQGYQLQRYRAGSRLPLSYMLSNI